VNRGSTLEFEGAVNTNLNVTNMPKLRSVDPLPVEVQGVRAIALKDPLQISDRMVCVHRDALHVLALLDGRHSLLDIQAELTRSAGRIVYAEEIQSLLDKLDEAYLLEGERFKAAFKQKVAEYRQLPFRPYAHAGMSYSGDADALKRELRAFFASSSGPGMPDLFVDRRRPLGLIAPHIDVKAGGSIFAHAYHALASGQPSDIYVIFGTGHAGVEGMFTATTLDFQTPIGIIETDRAFIADLSRELGRDCAAEEILHANEHVIEFQTIFLQYLLGGRRSFSIVPILCSLSHHFFEDRGRYREQKRMFDDFCAAMRAVCSRTSKSVCFIASADLDHVGPRYGDQFTPHEGTVKRALDRDALLLAHLEKLEMDEFVRMVARENDSSRICGFSPITAMLHCMDASEGRVLGLDFAYVDDRRSFVSFASMVFH
jgi:AmmeMemoRadiSam system protein B